MYKITWKDRLRYGFDNYMARGTGTLIGGLGVLSILLISVIAIVVSTVGIGPGDAEPVGFWEAFWLGMMRTLDAGTMGGDTGWNFRIAMFVVTLGGVFVISSLIGILTSGLEGKLDELRKGRSRVVENGHTVIMGWSSHIFSVVSELLLANANQPHARIVILGPKDKVEMEEEIRANVTAPLGRTRIICRNGSPIDLADLELVRLETSKAIVILSGETENPDANTIKTLLAITNSPNRRPEPYHIVAEIRDSRNMDVSKLVGKDEVELIEVGILISRIVAQTCRQSGLSVVYTELLDFGGDEIYFKKEPTLVGKTFAESLMIYEDSAVMGLYSSDGAAG